MLVGGSFIPRLRYIFLEEDASAAVVAAVDTLSDGCSTTEGFLLGSCNAASFNVSSVDTLSVGCSATAELPGFSGSCG